MEVIIIELSRRYAVGWARLKLRIRAGSTPPDGRYIRVTYRVGT